MIKLRLVQETCLIIHNVCAHMGTCADAQQTHTTPQPYLGKNGWDETVALRCGGMCNNATNTTEPKHVPGFSHPHPCFPYPNPSASGCRAWCPTPMPPSSSVCEAGAGSVRACVQRDPSGCGRTHVPCNTGKWHVASRPVVPCACALYVCVCGTEEQGVLCAARHDGCLTCDDTHLAISITTTPPPPSPPGPPPLLSRRQGGWGRASRGHC